MVELYRWHLINPLTLTSVPHSFFTVLLLRWIRCFSNSKGKKKISLISFLGEMVQYHIRILLNVCAVLFGIVSILAGIVFPRHIHMHTHTDIFILDMCVYNGYKIFTYTNVVAISIDKIMSKIDIWQIDLEKFNKGLWVCVVVYMNDGMVREYERQKKKRCSMGYTRLVTRRRSSIIIPISICDDNDTPVEPHYI